MLGEGSFGTVLGAIDRTRDSRKVAIKVARKDERVARQAGYEAAIVLHIMRKDPADQHALVRALDFFKYSDHVCLSFESLSTNLYQLLEASKFTGLSPSLIRAFGVQVSGEPSERRTSST